MFVLSDAKYLGARSPEQLQSLSLLLLQFDDHAAAMALGFFGIQSVLKGWLILRSGFLARWLAFPPEIRLDSSFAKLSVAADSSLCYHSAAAMISGPLPLAGRHEQEVPRSARPP